MSLQLISFDLDDTLWDLPPVIAAAEAELLAWARHQAPALARLPADALQAIRARLVEGQPDLRHRISQLRQRVLFEALRETGHPVDEAQELAAIAFEVFISARHKVQLFPEVESTLQALSQRFRLAVLTNGNADVRRLNLAHHFEVILCAEDLGIGKPDPAPFGEVLRRTGISAERAVHIGDHPLDDIAGAQGAGLRAIWFNPAGKPWAQERRPDAEIRNLAELPGLLRDW